MPVRRNQRKAGKPFVFLDDVDFIQRGDPMLKMHPHSGIATVTVLLPGDIRYVDTTGAGGLLAPVASSG